MCKDRLQSGLVPPSELLLVLHWYTVVIMAPVALRRVCVRSVRSKTDGNSAYASLLYIACLHTCLNRFEDLEDA